MQGAVASTDEQGGARFTVGITDIWCKLVSVDTQKPLEVISLALINNVAVIAMLGVECGTTSYAGGLVPDELFSVGSD